MAKDPAFLFYHNDFLVGTTFMSLEERGAYITLLCYLADKGTITEVNILKIIPLPIWEAICIKFKKDKDGFYNARLREEVIKRQKFTESRRKNLHMGNHMVKHMRAKSKPHMEDVNVNENKDVNINKDKDKDFNIIWEKYPSKVGRKDALRHFKASVKTDNDMQDIQKALDNYLVSERVLKGFIQNGSKWFNDWQGWITPEEPKRKLTGAQVEAVKSMNRLKEKWAEEDKKNEQGNI